MALAYNFKQLGEEVLSKYCTWMIPVTTRTSRIHCIMGGWGHMLAKYLHVHLLGSPGLATVRVVVMIHGAPLTIVARVRLVLADYDGIRMGWDWKRTNSIRPCPRCANIFKKDSDIAPRLPNCHDITCIDQSLLIERTAQEFEDDVDAVIAAGAEFAAGRMTKTRFESVQKAVG